MVTSSGGSPVEDVICGGAGRLAHGLRGRRGLRGVPFYLLWITDLDSLAHVNEARAG